MAPTIVPELYPNLYLQPWALFRALPPQFQRLAGDFHSNWTGPKLNSSSSSSRLGVLMTSFLTSVFLPVNQIKKLKMIFTLHPYPMFHPLTCQQNHQILSSLPLFYLSRISFFISWPPSGSGRSLAAQDLDPPFTLLSSLKGRGNLYSQCQSLCPWIKTPNWWPLLTGHSANSSARHLEYSSEREGKKESQGRSRKRYLVVKKSLQKFLPNGFHFSVVQKSHSLKLRVAVGLSN